MKTLPPVSQYFSGDYTDEPLGGDTVITIVTPTQFRQADPLAHHFDANTNITTNIVYIKASD